MFDDPVHNSGENFAFPNKSSIKFTRKESAYLKHIKDAIVVRDTMNKCAKPDKEIQSISNLSLK